LTNSPKKKINEIKTNCISSISGIESNIMKVIWDNGPLSVREVHKRLPRKELKDKKVYFVPYTTVMATMIKLAGKGLIKQDKTAKTYIYTAVVDRKELSKSIINSITEKLLEATTGRVYKFLSNEENVSIDGIKKLLNDIK
jgi:predicted transcriptional regulator